MNSKDIATAAVVAGSVTIAIVIRIKTSRNERRKRTEINAETQRQIQAMKAAAIRVGEKINKGGYDKKPSIDQAMIDVKFETIVERFKD